MLERAGAEMEAELDEVRGLPPARAFGRVEDLAIDFQRDRLMVVTEVLARCCVASGMPLKSRRNAAWNFSVGERARRLLKIVECSLGAPAFQVWLACPAAACQERFHAAVLFSDFAVRPATQEVGVELSGEKMVRLRVPTGRDQAVWKERRFATKGEAIYEMAISLARDASNLPVRLGRSDLNMLDLALTAADPLVAFVLRRPCPKCGNHAQFPVDLEKCALECLQDLRAVMIEDIHFFAKAYGWSERQTLAVPQTRRNEYRRLIAIEETELL